MNELRSAAALLLLSTLACNTKVLDVGDPDSQVALTNASPGDKKSEPSTDGSTNVTPVDGVPANAEVAEPVSVGGVQAQAYAVNGDRLESFGLLIPVKLIEVLSQASSSNQRIVVQAPPSVRAVTPIRAAVLEGFPVGHAPQGMYDVPHLDVHFLLTEPASVESIDCTSSTEPPAAMIPPDFISPTEPSSCLPKNGLPLWNTLEPAFQGQRFTASTALMTYDAQLIAFDMSSPYATLLERKTLDSFQLDRAMSFTRSGKPGRYPTSGVMTYLPTPDAYLVTLSNLVDKL